MGYISQVSANAVWVSVKYYAFRQSFFHRYDFGIHITCSIDYTFFSRPHAWRICLHHLPDSEVNSLTAKRGYENVRRAHVAAGYGGLGIIDRAGAATKRQLQQRTLHVLTDDDGYQLY
jgi:hypothetical protein